MGSLGPSGSVFPRAPSRDAVTGGFRTRAWERVPPSAGPSWAGPVPQIFVTFGGVLGGTVGALSIAKGSAWAAGVRARLTKGAPGSLARLAGTYPVPRTIVHSYGAMFVIGYISLPRAIC